MDLQELIKFCIDNFSSEEASKRIYNYIQDSLYLKEQEIELKNILSNKEEQEEVELTIEYLNSTVGAIYQCEYSSCDGCHVVYVDPNYLQEGHRELITKFWSQNRDKFKFIFKHQSLGKTYCNGHS